jgi:hypothetical protein
MWSSAATRRYVENAVAQGDPGRVLAYNVSFAGTVLPNDQLEVKLKRTCMRDGNIVVSIETTNSRGEKALVGTAEVKQPTTAYVFTGQGSQEPGMGMDLCNNSPLLVLFGMEPMLIYLRRMASLSAKSSGIILRIKLSISVVFKAKLFANAT